MTMPSSEITLLAGYSRVEPFGVRRHDLHHARTQALISNAVDVFLVATGATKRRRKAAHPSDFMHPRKKTERQKLNNLRAELSALAARSKKTDG